MLVWFIEFVSCAPWWAWGALAAWLFVGLATAGVWWVALFSAPDRNLRVAALGWLLLTPIVPLVILCGPLAAVAAGLYDRRLKEKEQHHDGSRP